jgi:hypothetical protein
MARAMFTLGASACSEGYVASRMLAEGPKVFAFDALAREALESLISGAWVPLPRCPSCGKKQAYRGGGLWII